MPPEQRNWFYRGFNAVYDRMERGYARLIGRLVAHANISVIFALILIGLGGYGLSRVPTGFIPIEDQGYLLAAVQLPDGASLERTQKVMDQVQEIVSQQPGVDQIIHHQHALAPPAAGRENGLGHALEQVSSPWVVWL